MHRCHWRQSLALDVTLDLGEGPLHVRTCDLGPGGMFVETGPVALPLDTLVALTLAIPGPERMTRHQIQAKVVRQTKRGAALAFIGATAEVDSALRSLRQRDVVNALGRRGHARS